MRTERFFSKGNFTLPIFLAALFGTLLVFYGCKKNDLVQNEFISTQQVNDFFKLPAGTPPETNVIATEMEKQL